MKRIVIVDYGLGNLRSVSRGLEKCGASPVITSDIPEITSAEGIVLPGVGAFRDGMEQLAAMGWRQLPFAIARSKATKQSRWGNEIATLRSQ